MPVGLSPVFAQFLDGFSVKSGAAAAAAAGAESTHYTFVGGKYIIPMHENQKFLRLYAQEWRAYPEDRLYFIERKTPIFRMHFDLDMVQAVPPTREHMLLLARLFCATMKTYYNEEELDPKTFVCIVLVAPSMPKRGVPLPGQAEADAPMVLKTGFHMIWPFLNVTKEQALMLRNGCVTKANQCLGPREPPMNSYSDMIDKTVLEENGLRMVGSDKAELCTRCKGKGVVRPPLVPSVEECHWCGRSGRISTGRVYKPDFVVGPDGNFDMARYNGITGVQNRYNCAHFCSIRTAATEPTPTFKPPPLAPTSAALEEKAAPKRRRITAGSTSLAASGAPGEEGSSKVEIGQQTALFKMMEDFLRTQMGGEQWANVELSHLDFSPPHNCYMAKVRGEGASYCMNVRRCHSSSTIYFVVKPTGVQQHCYSKKEGTADTKCKSYAGPLVKLPAVLQATLFKAPSETVPANGVVMPAADVVLDDAQKHAIANMISLANLATRKRQRRGAVGAHLSKEEADAQRAADEKVKQAIACLHPHSSATAAAAPAASDEAPGTRAILTMKPHEVVDFEVRKQQQMSQDIKMVRKEAYGDGALPLGVGASGTKRKGTGKRAAKK